MITTNGTMTTNNGIDVLRTAWFTQYPPFGPPLMIGIIYGRDKTTGEIEAYIGGVNFGENEDEASDINLIAEWGAPFPVDAAAVIFQLAKAKADPAKKEEKP